MILLFSILFGVSQAQPEEPVELLELFNNQPIRHEVHSGAEKRFEELSSAVVEIRNPYGYGTGTVVKYDSKVFVITAAHVVRGFDSVQVISGNQSVDASIAYSDLQSDLAILSLSQEIETRPLKLKPRRSSTRIGEELAYCGYPNRTDVACFKGAISITSDSFVNLHSYAWKGASGSLVVDFRGRAVGIVSAVEVGHFLGMPALIEDIVWIKPFSDEFYEAIEEL